MKIWKIYVKQKSYKNVYANFNENVNVNKKHM